MYKKPLSFIATPVLRFAFILISSFLPSPHHQTSGADDNQKYIMVNPNSNNSDLCGNKEKIDYNIALRCNTDKNPEKCKKEQEKRLAEGCARKAIGDQGGLQDCANAYKQFVENEGKLQTACAGAGINDCFAHIDKCLKCQGTDPTSSACQDLETTDIDNDNPRTKPASINDLVGFGQSKLSSASSTKYTPDPEKAERRYKNCPALAGVDLKDWMSRVKEAQTAVIDAKKEMADLNKENTDIQNKLKDESIQKDKEMNETVSEAEDVRQKMNNQMDEEKNKARQTVSQLLEQSSQVEQQILAAEKAYEDSYSAYLNAIATLDQQCHAAALQKLTALQTEKQSRIDKSTYSTHSFNNLINQVGVSSRKKSQQMMNRDFQQCKADPAYKSSVEASKRALDSSRKAANNAIAALKQKREQIASTIRDANERELPETLKRVIANSNRELSKLQEKLKQLAIEKQTAIDKANSEIIANNQKIEIAKQKLDIAEENLRQNQAYLNKKNAYSEGVETDQHKISEALGAMSTLHASAETVAASCNCKMDPGSAENTSHCTKACKILIKSHENWEPSEAISDDMLAGECSSLSPSAGSSGSAGSPSRGQNSPHRQQQPTRRSGSPPAPRTPNQPSQPRLQPAPAVSDGPGPGWNQK